MRRTPTILCLALVAAAVFTGCDDNNQPQQQYRHPDLIARTAPAYEQPQAVDEVAAAPQGPSVDQFNAPMILDLIRSGKVGEDAAALTGIVNNPANGINNVDVVPPMGQVDFVAVSKELREGRTVLVFTAIPNDNNTPSIELVTITCSQTNGMDAAYSSHFVDYDRNDQERYHRDYDADLGRLMFWSWVMHPTVYVYNRSLATTYYGYHHPILDRRVVIARRSAYYTSAVPTYRRVVTNFNYVPAPGGYGAPAVAGYRAQQIGTERRVGPVATQPTRARASGVQPAAAQPQQQRPYVAPALPTIAPAPADTSLKTRAGQMNSFQVRGQNQPRLAAPGRAPAASAPPPTMAPHPSFQRTPAPTPRPSYQAPAPPRPSFSAPVAPPRPTPAPSFSRPTAAPSPSFSRPSSSSSSGGRR